MKQHHPLIIAFAKGLSALLRILLSLRYKVEVKGANVLQSSTPMLVLPNHQALIDPIIIISQIYKRTTVIPVITSGYYDIPVIRNLFREWGAVRVSDLESGSRNTNVLNEITTAVNGGFAMGKNIILYPSGQIAGQGYEKIFNKKSAHNIVSEIPAHVKVIGVRINGLWGSMWSKAWTGKSGNFVWLLFKAIFYILVNLIFFLPRRKVTVEFADLTTTAKANAKEGRQAFNSGLEEYYNRNGVETPLFLKHYFYGPKLNRMLPATISGSVDEKEGEALPTDVENIPVEVLEKVKAIVAKTLSINATQITPNSYLIMDLGADSLNLVEIVSEVENQFPTFSSPEINDIKTIGDLCLVAMGQFSSEADLKPSNLNQPLSRKGYITVEADKNILWQFLDSFTENPNDPFTYDAMLGSTDRKAFLLKACVVSQHLKKRVKGKHVGIMLPATQSATLLVIASYMAGKIPVMLNWTVGKKVLEHCIETAEVEVILSASTFISKVEELLPESIKSKLLYLDKEAPNIALSTKLKGVLTARLPKLFLPYKKLDEIAVILFTSGSEALPKAVPLTHRNITSDLNSVFRMLEIDRNYTFLGFLPPFHSFGFTVLIALPLAAGLKVAYTPNPTDAREVLKILKHTKANILLGTPGFLKLLMGVGSAYYFKTIRLVISGAEAMTPVVKEQFDRLTTDAYLIEGYGITECAPIIAANLFEKQKLNSVGKILPDVECIILDLNTGQRCQPGEAGMIYVRGANVFSGYLGNEVASPFEEIDGKTFYKTGDLGYLDEEDFLYITGRLKRFIKIAGEMISLPFIENILLEKYGEEERQVLAIEGSDKTVPPQIVLFAAIPIDMNEANDYLISHGVAPIAKIKSVIQLEEIPLLGTGKTDYKVLRQLIEK
ncbi:MAG: AMP-binding protein [Bacteroidota bacterium]|nr:AMP-binding protein [Bacteroidota bacterium]